MNTIEAIRTRRSVRTYKDEPVEREKIATLLRAAMSAPSAGNQQPWHFVVVTDTDMLKQIAELNPNARMAAQAPAGILVCGDPREEKYPGYWVQDCTAATQNILLAAHELGLGAVWTGVYPREPRIEAFKKVFKLPEPILPLSFIILGYPAETAAPQDRFRTDRVHENAW